MVIQISSCIEGSTSNYSLKHEQDRGHAIDIII